MYKVEPNTRPNFNNPIGPNGVYTADKSPGTCRAVDVARESTWFAYTSAVPWPLSLTAFLYPSTGRHVLRRLGTFGAFVKVTSDDETAPGMFFGR
ncbi:uncharacterized protein N7525_000457 [Penicillium rubens]|uniref:uncharacterized protein n=1 Tax=Penicillium rubens TaxID=1108849 RepID=UPI002A5A2016|nr:uncharacterized protein N7525_000457 [Penicillium rubens]KAJ5842716.1 hypothetical protein N7525_000457 [Penicillium rubens]